MTREEFIRICSVFGIGIPFQNALSSCGSDEEPQINFSGKVLIIGAGAGGMAAGYFLNQHGTDFEILEASNQFGGRMRINTDFADFPIPLGSEWLETDIGIFNRIVNDTSVTVDIQTHPDLPDRKFVNSSWFQFFEEYIYPSVSDKIRFNTIVKSVDYSSDQVILQTDSEQFQSDRAIVSVPLKILQEGDISFTPSLPTDKLLAINNAPIWDGFKAFIEFSINFYEEEYVFAVSPATDGEKIYYDATLGQSTNKHILGLFVVGKPVSEYADLSDNDLIAYILAELDSIYNNQATPNYIKHISQNWNSEPFIKGGYLSDHADWQLVRTLGDPVSGKLYYAGGPYTDGEDWVSVHAAADSAKQTVNKLLYS